MQNNIFLIFLGIFLTSFGLVISYNPELIINKPIPIDPFEAVERRVWWGVLIGIGMLLLFHHQLKPYLLTLAAAGACVVSGILIARFIGIIIDGSTPMQWFWVVVELLIIVALAFWYFKQRKMI